MDDLLSEFIAETRDMLRGCEEALVSWEADPADRTRLDAIFRFVHTVKGNCGFFDLPRLAALSHGAEDVLGQLREGTRSADAAVVTAVLGVIDRIMLIIDALDSGAPLPNEPDEPLLTALMASGPVAAATASPTACPATLAQPVARAAARSIRLPVDLLDRVMSGVSDMVLARNDLARRLREGHSAAELDAPFERLSGILSDVREAITRMRMNRIDHLFQQLPRLVRDLAHELGKEVRIVCHGGEVELDREIMDLIRDPVTHILRNAIDHGIEPAGDRLAAGKPRAGTIVVEASHAGNEVRLTIADDGRGIDRAKVARKAVDAGLIDADEASRADPRRCAELIFAAGLSTADAVSAVSGRGVGMDVVRANLERIGGAISVTSRDGAGTTFQLRVPLTLCIVPGIVVRTAALSFAVPQAHVVEIVRRRSVQLDDAVVGTARLIAIRGERMPYLDLAQVMGLAPAEEGGCAMAAPVVLVLQTGADQRCAIGVERICDYEDLVVKPLAPAVMQTGYYAGLTLLDDGQPILLLDVRSIMERAGVFGRDAAPQAHAADEGSDAEDHGEPVLLFTGFDGVERAVPFAAVERIVALAPEAITRNGTSAFAALDGVPVTLLGLDDAAISHCAIHAISLSDGGTRLLLAAAAIGERAVVAADMLHAPASDDEARVFLIAERACRLVDVHRLFAEHAPAARPSRAMVCAVPDDDWAKRMLVPLLRAAGWAVAPSGDGSVDLVISIDGRAPDGTTTSAPRIALSSADAATLPPGVVHRYDRDRLLAALAAVRQAAA
ncbi:chemotaxis protein CheA [Erythrobacteraceae bacterium CFH 75059]|uniref:chemotaxis protein CheA n=1 Tax=Qipengyuania thermophila TaxID=2509361 RepID=UPI00101F4C62|nr:chemotaxis protein CheA [Qipengyuania thermophila]TCD04100.1 chemotaxis protein CheA [Erythrobacteraceae bacterium CFH 75059]